MFGAFDAAVIDSGCTASSSGNCPCGSLADFCASRSCLSTLAEADDASAWGPGPNCDTEESTNACANQIEIRQSGIDTGETFFYDRTTGALTGAIVSGNLNAICFGVMPGGNCDDIWTLEPRFGVVDAGVCYGDETDADIGDAGSSDAADD